MSFVQSVIPAYAIYDFATGRITVPFSGVYQLEMQGVFQNSPSASNVENGVYYRFLNHPYPSARIGANFTPGRIVSTSVQMFLLGGDVFLPTFFSNDSDASLVKTDGETYIKIMVTVTFTPQHSNYVRVPLLNYP